jgi:hypothetical protein
MENLSPTLYFVVAIKTKIEQGESVRSSLLSAISNTTEKSVLRVALEELVADDLGQVKKVNRALSIWAQQLVNLCARGLNGESIHSQLIGLEKDVLESALEEIDVYAAKLPVIGLLPLLLFVFPAIAILLIGPELLRVLSVQ